MKKQYTVDFDVKYNGEMVYDCLVTAEVTHYVVKEADPTNNSSDWDCYGYTDFDFELVSVELTDLDGSSVTIKGDSLESIEMDELMFAFALESQVKEYIEDYNNEVMYAS